MFREAGSDFVIMDSCNGLLLCCIKPNKYYVYNPTIKVFKMLPQCEELLSELSSGRGCMRLAFDPTKSPYYKVHHRLGYDMKTYSSETGNWRTDIELKYVFCDLFDNGIYWKDIFHGLQIERTPWYCMLITGERNVSRSLAVTPITSLTFDEKPACKNCKLFESCGCLYLVGTFTQHLPVYEMRKRYSEWSLKYVINLDDVMMLLDENQRMSSKWDCSRIWSIVLGEREEDSFLVMELFGKVVQYNIGLKSILEVYDLRSISTSDMDPTKLDTFHFIASSASV